MESYFVNVQYVKRKEDIPIKHEIIRHAPENIFKWYVKKFNPYLMEKAYIGDCQGYNISLPIIETEKYENQELILRTLENLYDDGVRVLNFNDDFEFIEEFDFFRPKGDLAFTLFLKEVFMKAVRYTGIELKYADVCIIGDDNFYTEKALGAIYPEVNYLTLILPKEIHHLFSQKVEAIFSDTGLYIQILEKGDISSADIIINTSEDRSFDYGYKRGLLYIEPPINAKRFSNLISKREDIFAVNKCTVSFQDCVIDLCSLEAYLYLKEPLFRRLVKGYGALSERRGEFHIDLRGAGVKYLYRNNTEISKFNLKKYLIKAGR